MTVDGADGILGIGPDRLSIYNNPDNKIIPTLVTTMVEDGIIDHNVFSVYFQPVTHTGLVKDQKRINGEIVFGGGESSFLFDSFFHYCPKLTLFFSVLSREETYC